jgi:ATP-dependent Clp protease ATP-binding subunit ClpC
MLNNLAVRLKQNEIGIEVSDEAKTFIAKKGFDPVYGARPLRRSIQNMIEDKMAEEMLEGSIKAGDSVLIDLDEEKIIFSVKSRQPKDMDKKALKL